MINLLKEFGRGQITLPKKWRDRFGTNIYVAKETSQGLLIIPFTDDIVKVDEQSLRDEVTSSDKKHSTSFFKKKSIRKDK